MLTKDAIDRIVELGHTAHTLDDNIITLHPIVTLPAGAQVVDLEKYMATPARMRRAFSATRIGEFSDYIKHHMLTAGTAIFVAPDGRAARAIIDYGSHDEPQWGDHTAQLTLPTTPEFTALSALVGKALTQRDLIEYLEDWGTIITPRIGEQEISLAAALDAIRKVKISQKASTSHTEGNFNAARTAMEEIEAKSGAGRLPSDFIVRCPVVHGTALRDIPVRLSLITGGKPQFRARIVALELIEKDLAEEVENLIRGFFRGTAALVFIGQIK